MIMTSESMSQTVKKVLNPERRLRVMEELRQVLCLSVPAEVLSDAMDSTKDKDELGGGRSQRNARLAQLGDSVLDLIIIEALFRKGLPGGYIEPLRQILVCNDTQHRLLTEIWRLTPYYYNDQGFFNDPDIDRPASSSSHIPYLEAIIGAVYLNKGFEYTKSWVINVVYPGLVKAAGH